ncbi:MAG: DUF2924 domain-containing protein [Candidatus Eisenbacteria bacterium]
MKAETRERIEALDEMTVAELREEYARVWGEPTRSRHKRYLQKRIAWGLQANDEGGLSERALRRAEELANEADLRLLAPRGRRSEVRPFRPPKPQRDPRLPMPGTVLTREYKGTTVAVTVLDEGFEYRGEVYRSLSSIAKKVTGSHWNGFHFFGLDKETTR